MNIFHQLRADQRLINRELKKMLRFNKKVPCRLAQAVRYAVLSKGKRLRPVLTLEAFRACGGRRLDWVIPFCCGIELIHTFSLIHDDLPSMDNDDYRRGQPTVHRQFDEATAILAGDGLLALAYELFMNGPAPIARRGAATLLISRSIGISGMAGGQMLDIIQNPPNKKVQIGQGFSLAKLVRIAELKTGMFFAASLGTGAIIANASPKLEKRLEFLGMKLGVLFQLTDDLLDQERYANKLRRKAEILAEKTRDGFLALGPKFVFFAELVPFVLNRKE